MFSQSKREPYLYIFNLYISVKAMESQVSVNRSELLLSEWGNPANLFLLSELFLKLLNILQV